MLIWIFVNGSCLLAVTTVTRFWLTANRTFSLAPSRHLDNNHLQTLPEPIFQPTNRLDTLWVLRMRSTEQVHCWLDIQDVPSSRLGYDYKNSYPTFCTFLQSLDENVRTGVLNRPRPLRTQSFETEWTWWQSTSCHGLLPYSHCSLQTVMSRPIAL